MVTHTATHPKFSLWEQLLEAPGKAKDLGTLTGALNGLGVGEQLRV